METPLKVIIIEDEAVIAQLLEYHIQESGHQVLDVAHSSERALDLIHNLQPDLILLDIHILGERDGIEVGMIVKEKYDIPIIFITALSDLDTIQRAKKAGPVSYLVKPYKPDDLKAAISIGMYNYGNRNSKKSITLKQVNIHALSPLSKREFDILSDLTEGLTNDQIAAKQFLSLNTIKWHSSNIYSKLGVKNRTSAAKFMAELEH